MSLATPLLFSAAADIDRLLPVFEAVSTAGFAAALLDVVDAEFGSVEVFAFECRPQERDDCPRPITYASRRGDVYTRVEQYCRHFAPFDSTLHHLAQGEKGRIGIARSRLSQRPRDRYRALFSDNNNLDERFSLGFNGSSLIVLNLYQPATVPMSEAAVEKLIALAPALLSAIGAHQREMSRSTVANATPPRPASARDKEVPDRPEALEAMLADVRPDMPMRELEVCARTVTGMTAQAIALDLGISISTVATYRRRAYQRMGICSAYELMGALMRRSSETFTPARRSDEYSIACAA